MNLYFYWYLLILNLTPSGKILGAQKRKFSGTNRFETYKLSKLYEEMKRPFEVNDEQKNYLDTLSMIFNICLIDLRTSVPNNRSNCLTPASLV